MLVASTLPESRAKLESLLSVSAGARLSLLDRLRNRRSAPELVRALQRVQEVRRLGIDLQVSQRIPPGRLQALARFASTAKVSAVQRLPDSRRLATLVAFACNLEARALDDALDLLDILITEIFNEAEKSSDKARLRTIKDLVAAAMQLSQVCRLVLDDKLPDAELRTTIFAATPIKTLETAVSQVDSLVRPPEDVYYRELEDSYQRVRRFLPHLLETVQFGATPAGEAVLEAIKYLCRVEEHGRTTAGDPPMSIISRGWRRYVLDGETFDRKAYVFCCLDRIRSALRRRDLFVAPSIGYADARLGLLSEAAWDAARLTVCRSLGHPLSAEGTIAGLSQELDQTYRTVASNLPSNTGARVERREDGKDELIVTALDKLEEPDSLIKLREAVNARLPHVDLPEILLEVAARTNFTGKFTHVSARESRANDIGVSICANLIAEACNTGPESLIRNDVPALRRARLSWVVPVRTLHAGPNPKYFGYERGVTYYNLVSNQFTGLNAIVIPGTIRDSLFLLSVVLEQQTELQPVEIMTDTGAYTDVVFGLFWLFGYRFSPRIADIGGARYWRIDPTADYGLLNGIARHRINTKLILENWDDMLRLTGYLKLGVVQAMSVMRTLQIGDRPTKLAQAVAELS